MTRAVPPIIPGVEMLSGSQPINGSLKFNEDHNTYLKVTPGSAGNRRTWTWSGWVKRNTFGSSLMSRFFMGGTNSTSSGSTVLAFYQDSLFVETDASSARITTNRVFRDTGWYHIVLAVDTSLASDYGTYERVKIYVNGKKETSFSAAAYPGENKDTGVNSTEGMLLGAGRDSSGNEPDGPFDGQLSQVYLIDGLQLGPGYFGFTDPQTGTWKPKKFRAKGTTVNDGRVFSSTGTFSNWDDDGTYPKTKLFDGQTYDIGDTSPKGASSDSSSEATFDFGDQRITGFDNLQVNIFLSSNQASATNVVSVNGIDITQECHRAGNNIWTTVDLGSKFNTLQSFRIANNNIYVGGFFIDGVIMKDSTTTNLSFGTNGFYLPLDGNSPIGQDKSGNGNDLTPLNFGGSVSLDNPQVSGARPILNTTQGGTQAGVDVFGSKENKFYTVTTANGSVYQFDITSGDNPSLEFVRGATYRFDYTSHASHPLRFSSTNPDSSTTAYTQGTNTSVSNVITITVPHDAPDTLYYYCTAHASAMNGAITVTTDNTKADQYASSCVLALPLVGVATDVCASIACTMSSKALSVSGATADSFERNFYGESFIFDGSNDEISCSAGSDFDFGGGDFTLETWLNMDTIGAGQAILEYSGQSSSSAPDGQWYFSTSNGWQWFHNSSSYAIIPKARVPVDKWIHMALVREGNAITHYLNGVCEASSSYTRTDAGSSSRALIIGQQNSSSYYDGHLQDYRVYKGVAKYSGTTVGTQYFVPPSPRFPDILPDTPSGATSSKLTKITDGAVSFDGSDFLESKSTTDFAFGTGDFTLEAYIYATSLPGTNNRIFCSGAAGAGDRTNFQLMVGSAGYLEFAHTTNYQTENGLIGTNKWYHVAATREGTSLKMFIDGILRHTGTSNVNVTENGGVTIGKEFGYSSYWNGFISNARILKGTALYTENFVVPSAPLTNVTNTKLLCCQSNTLAGSAAVAPTISGLNDGRVWSSGSTTGSVYASDNDWNNVFNGVAGNDKAIAANDATYEITLPGGGISGVTKVEIYGQQQAGAANATITLSSAGEQSVAQGTSLGYTTFYTGSSDTLTKLKVASTSSNRSSINAVRINDTTILTDPLANSVGLNPGATAATFNPFNTDIKTVRGEETVYCTMNPLTNVQGVTLSDGNLKCNWPTDGDGEAVAGTIAIPMGVRGKFYWELDVKAATGGGLNIGIVRSDQTKWTDGTISNRLYNHPEFAGLLGNSGSFRNKTGTDSDVSNYLSSISNGSSQTFMVCVDALEGKMWIGKDGIWGTNGNIGNPALGLNPGTSNLYNNHRFSYLPVMMGASDSGTSTTFWNFGQKPFKYAPPDGFQPLNNVNVRPTTVFSRPDHYVGITTWKGNGDLGTKIISHDFNFEPDFIWAKELNGGSSHALFDSVRGYGSNNVLCTNNSNAAGVSNGGYINSTTKSTITWAQGSSSGEFYDASGKSYIAWCWKAGGNKGTFTKDGVGFSTCGDGVAIPVSSINTDPTGYSIGTEQGFSILKYNGTGSNRVMLHGLSKPPEFVIFKRTNGTKQWMIAYPIADPTSSSAVDRDNYLKFDTTTGTNVSPFQWFFTQSDRIIMESSAQGHNESGGEYVAYCWHSVPGLQRFGRYTGNGLADGPYIELGFKPAFLIVKNISSSGTSRNWAFVDSHRSFANVANHTLSANLASAESAYGSGASVFGANNKFDLLSNGFKIRENAIFHNTSGEEYIFMAWAEAPTVNLYGGGAGAR